MRESKRSFLGNMFDVIVLVGVIYLMFSGVFWIDNQIRENQKNIIKEQMHTFTYIEVYTKTDNTLIFKGDVANLSKNIFSDGVTFYKNGIHQELKGNVIIGRTIIKKY
jgi:hypothetical protein